jgi:hypothetical protein
VYNSTGLLVFRSENIKFDGQNNVKLDVSSLPAGIYSVRVSQEETVFNRVFVKQ